MIKESVLDLVGNWWCVRSGWMQAYISVLATKVTCDHFAVGAPLLSLVFSNSALGYSASVPYEIAWRRIEVSVVALLLFFL